MKGKTMFEVNDIIVCEFGYNCRFVDFYKVVGVTKSGKSIKIRQVGEKVVSHDEYGQSGFVKPSDEFCIICIPLSALKLSPCNNVCLLILFAVNSLLLCSKLK